MKPLLAVMDAANVRTLVILTGPIDPQALGQLVDVLVRPNPGRFVVFTQVDWSKADEPGFGTRAAATLRQAVARGARGLKVLKALGLYHRDRKGKLLAVDDPRFDPIWAECGRLQIPVAIHTGDPEAFFHPADRHNERLEELWMNPDWSFHGKDNPDLPSLLAARDRVIARHPAHHLRRPARGRLAREPGLRLGAAAAVTPTPTSSSGPARPSWAGSRRRTRRLFLEFPDRILFGTDFGPSPELYASHFRWLETADEYFPYFQHPEQGRWGIYGLELPARGAGEDLQRQRPPHPASARATPQAADAKTRTWWSRARLERELDVPAAAALGRAGRGWRSPGGDPC